jgi:flagellin-like hook-associated protein FlgL
VINFSKAATAGDIIRIINESGLDLNARINDLGTGISVTSIIGGRTLKITDGIGDFTATLLGIQGSRDVLVDPVSPIGAESELLPAINGETRLSDLNKGRGVASEVIKITDSLGNAQYISITGVNTIQGVLNLINEIGAEGRGLINVVAELSPNQQGISIIDKSISNTVIREITTTGALSADINDLAAGDAIVVNVFKLIDGSETASHMDMVLKPVAGEISLAGTIETIDKGTRQISLRTPDGILYNVLSQQPVDNFFIGQSMHVNGEITPGGDFSARTVALVESPGAGEEQLVGRIESVDLANKTVSLTLEDGSTRQIKLITERGPIKVEDTADGTTAADLGIRGISVAGSDRIVGSALDPLITTNTKLSLLNGGTFIPGKIRIANGDRDVVVDLSNAETINELLALINNSAAAVVAAINDAGTGISLRSRINGTTLMVTKTTLKNPDRSNKVYPDGTTIFDETADLLALTGSEDIVGNLLFLRNALLENNQQDIQKTLSKFPQGLNRILNQRTKIGARANQLETTQDRGLDSNLINTEILSRTEDLDVVEAISELAARENAFNAALGAASRIILPSLLDYL